VRGRLAVTNVFQVEQDGVSLAVRQCFAALILGFAVESVPSSAYAVKVS
jgi:hypothetical protein